MKISTTTGTLMGMYGDEKALVKIANAGFDAVDYSMHRHDAHTGVYTGKGFEKYAEKIKTVADAVGLKIGQIHAHMPSPSYPDYMANRELYDTLAVNAIISAAIMECPYVVVHPLIMLDRLYDRKYKENYEANLEYYGKMIPYLKESGVKIAIENMWHFDDEKNKIVDTVCSSPEEMLSLADDLGDDFVFCLDIGHCALTDRKPQDVIRKLGDRLKVLHVHDNDSIDDTHDLPYNANPINMQFPENPNKINWDEVLKALKEINYDGTFSLEADCFLKKYPTELYEDALKFMGKVARYMANKY